MTPLTMGEPMQQSLCALHLYHYKKFEFESSTLDVVELYPGAGVL